MRRIPAHGDHVRPRAAFFPVEERRAGCSVLSPAKAFLNPSSRCHNFLSEAGGKNSLVKISSAFGLFLKS